MAFKAGFLGLIGLPNAGKSSFLNNVLGETLAIVSHKPQATRKRVQGILTSDEAQIVFVDAPGFLQKGRNAMLKFIAEEARQVIRDVDAVLLLVPCDDVSSDTMLPLIDLIKTEKKPWVVCITKRDLKEADGLKSFVQYCLDQGVPVFNYSVKNPAKAQKGELIKALEQLLPESPAPLFDPELFTTETVRDIAAEMIRERCFELLKQEIPFGLAVVIDKYKEDKKMIRIEATLLVEKESHKGIVIGARGEMLKKIGTQAREKLEKMTGEKVFVGLHVSHKQNWTRQERKMKELGYESK